MSSTVRRLFIATDEQGNLQLGGNWALAEVKGEPVRSVKSVDGTGAVKLVDANSNRKVYLFKNMSTTDRLYIGEDASVTVADGFPIEPGEAFSDDITDGQWWGITEGNTVELRQIEVSYST